MLRISLQQAAMESPHTFAQQVVSNADHWTLEFTWPRMSHGDAEITQAWIDSLRGQLGTFLYQPRLAYGSDLTGRTLALPAYSYGSLVTMGGWAANAASSLYLGQYCQIGTRLHRVVSAPANANTSGQCTVELAPQIRSLQPAGTPINFQTPKGTFRLVSGDSVAYTLDVDRQPSFPSIQAKEAL
ncbi:hypothetical protein KCP91_12085 [Microvirga sp. SRT01]|uniref:Uncharacterized protein n=1 Tax=Sphingomonas longa TaxID=2778730 RepID=A0ABS2D885_9SPHN|nr:MULTISPECIES: hypothetical protein [Alphaproteobacteria]MBM6577112.1 hypothetical protein [Sphingomonas sp. BT552]MBR7710156.1 hypothetical protein [Microvirga sp. SRT01]